jgi:hypothetical protein
MKGVELTKIKCTHSGDTLRHTFGINDERQNCEIGAACREYLWEGGGWMEEMKMRQDG